MTLGQAKFVNMSSVSRDSAPKIAVWGVRKGSNNLVGWLTKTWTKRWCIMSKLEILELFWFNVEKEIEKLKENGMLEWICYLKPTHPHWEGPEGIPFTMRNKFVREAPSILEELWDHSFLWTRLIYNKNCSHWIGKPRCNGGNWIPGGSSQGSVQLQRQDECGYYNGQQSQTSRQNTLTHMDLWHWPITYGVPRSETDRKATTSSFDQYKQKSSRSSEQKSNLNHEA